MTEQGFEMLIGTTIDELRKENAALQAKLMEWRSILAEALDNDEVMEGFNEANLGDELRQRIREAIGND